MLQSCKIINVRSRHPQSQGSVKIVNQDVEVMLRSWHEWHRAFWIPNWARYIRNHWKMHMLLADRKLRVLKIVGTIDISIDSVVSILNAHFGMRNPSLRWIMHFSQLDTTTIIWKLRTVTCYSTTIWANFSPFHTVDKTRIHHNTSSSSWNRGRGGSASHGDCYINSLNQLNNNSWATNWFLVHHILRI